MDKQTVNIHGREYETVASRLSRFISENPRYSVSTTITPNGTGCYARCTITVYDEEYKEVKHAVGNSYEKQDASMINKTSHVENAETSAVGRALAFLGYGGSDVASADEVVNAVRQQRDAVDKKSNGNGHPGEFVDDGDLDNWVFPFGKKFPGSTLNRIANSERGIDYLEWFVSRFTPRSDKERDYQEIVKRYLDINFSENV